MKSKIWLPLIVLLVIPLSFAYLDQSLNYDSNQNNVKITYDNLNRIMNKNKLSPSAKEIFDEFLKMMK